LAEAEWGAAREAFEGALAGGESAEALAGLAEAVFGLGDFRRALQLRERAYLLFRERGERAAAAGQALKLATDHGAMGSGAVSNGWLERAARLLGEVGECPERGWLLLRRSRTAASSRLAEEFALEAIRLARTLEDRDLEIAAIIQQGRALLAAGRIDEGFRRLDEAMAAATSGEARDKMTVGDACCDMISACERAADTERANQWCQVTDEYAKRTHFVPMFAFCRATYASVLMALGRWPEAERELQEALRSYDASFAVMSFTAAVRLAELRLLQGRDADAEEILADHLKHPGAARAVALLRLARGDAAGAVRVLRNRMTAVGSDLLLLAPVLSLLVEALIAQGEIKEAAAATKRLGAIAETTGMAAFLAAASYASGLVALARKHAAAAGDCFETSARAFASAGMPLQEARARVGLARCLADGDARAAKEECGAAVATFERLGARRDLDAATDLRRRLGVGARLGPRVSGTLTRREGEVLALLGLGLSNARIGARLFISPKTVEHHVGHILDKLDLETRGAATAYALRSSRPKADQK